MSEGRTSLGVWAALAVALAVAIGWWRRRDDAATEDKDDDEGDTDPCALVSANPVAYAYCRAGKAGVEIADVILDEVIVDVNDYLENNIAKNGAVIDANPLGITLEYMRGPNMMSQAGGGRGDAPDGGGFVPPMAHRPPLHANGCIPCVGAYLGEGAGHHLCAAGTGTRPYSRQEFARRPDGPGGDRRAYTEFATARWRGALPVSHEEAQHISQGSRGVTVDPTTHPHWDSLATFPIAVPEGRVPWWIVGRPVTLAPGEVPYRRLEGRGLACRIVEVGGLIPSEPPPVAYSDETGVGGGVTSPGAGGVVVSQPGTGPVVIEDEPPLTPTNDDPLYVWVAFPPPDTGGYWDRRRT